MVSSVKRGCKNTAFFVTSKQILKKMWFFRRRGSFNALQIIPYSRFLGKMEKIYCPRGENP